MQFESHATPYGGTPQHRYATLHRALEKGLDSDEVLIELAKVCATLGHRNEAVRCMQRIRNGHARATVQHFLKRKFSAGEGSHAPAPRPRPAASARPATAARPTVTPRGARPSAAPAASDAGPRADGKQQSPDAPGVGEHLLDAVQYLLHQHMPWLVLTTMLAFPVLVGVGGFLTAGGSLLLLAAIAALPGISVLAVVAAMGRRILLSSASGEGDVPVLPEFAQLLRDARRFGADALLITATFFSLPIALFFASAPLPVVVSTWCVGAFFAPLGFALRQIRGDMRALAPPTLLRAAHRCGKGYIVISMVATLAFAPAGLVAMTTVGSPIWVQIALVGPLCVLPVFAASRLVGSWIDTRRDQLGYLIKNREQTVRGNADAPAAQTVASQTKAQPRQPKKPAQLQNFRAPVVKNRTASFAVQTAGQQPEPAQRPARPTPRAIEGRGPAARKPARPAAQQPEAPARRPRTAPRGDTVAAGTNGDAPDLGGIPGAFVVSGEDRHRKGAASRRP